MVRLDLHVVYTQPRVVNGGIHPDSRVLLNPRSLELSGFRFNPTSFAF